MTNVINDDAMAPCGMHSKLTGPKDCAFCGILDDSTVSASYGDASYGSKSDVLTYEEISKVNETNPVYYMGSYYPIGAMKTIKEILG